MKNAKQRIESPGSLILKHSRLIRDNRGNNLFNWLSKSELIISIFSIEISF